METSTEQFLELTGQYVPDAAPGQTLLLAKYLALVAEYSGALNLTGFGSNPARLCFEMAGEAARLLSLGPVAPGLHCIDLGSGNGSPVVPLAILCPQTDFLAVDSRQRRTAFLSTVLAKLGLDNLEIRTGRVEDVARERPNSFDLVTSRAFAQPDKLLPIALSLVVERGEVRGFIGDEPGTLNQAASALGLDVVDLVSYEVQTNRRHVYRLQA